MAHLYLGSFSYSSLQILSSSVRLDREHHNTAVFRSLQRCLIGFKSGFWLGHARTFRDCCLGCVLRVVVLLEGEPSPSLRSEARFHHGYLIPSILYSLLVPPAEKTSSQHNAATTMLHRRDGIKFPPDVALGIQAKEFNLGFMRQENLVSHCLRVFSFLLANSKWIVMCLFTEEWLPSGYSTIKALLVECCRDGCPSGRFSHLHRGTLELCQSDHWVLGHLFDQGPSSPIAQFGRAASSKSLVGSKRLPFKNDGGHCVLGDLQCCRHFLVPFPRFVP